MTPTNHTRFSIPRLAAAAILGAALTVSPARAQDDKVLAKVGDKEITQSALDQAMKDMSQQFDTFPEAERRARALDALIDINVLAQQAEADGLQKDPEFVRRIELLRNRALHNGYFQKNVQEKITDEQIKERFEKEVAKVDPDQEISARHILVKTEDEAKAIIKELEGGADFVELAKTKSTGPSGPKGGDLGFFGKGRMVPEFEKAAFGLEKGDYTKEPVKTQFGYHIIKVEDKRDKPLPTFEASKDQLRQVMLAEAYAEAVKASREELGVEIVEESLKLPDEPKQ